MNEKLGDGPADAVPEVSLFVAAIAAGAARAHGRDVSFIVSAWFSPIPFIAALVAFLTLPPSPPGGGTG